MARNQWLAMAIMWRGAAAAISMANGWRNDIIENGSGNGAARIENGVMLLAISAGHQRKHQRRRRRLWRWRIINGSINMASAAANGGNVAAASAAYQWRRRKEMAAKRRKYQMSAENNGVINGESVSVMACSKLWRRKAAAYVMAKSVAKYRRRHRRRRHQRRRGSWRHRRRRGRRRRLWRRRIMWQPAK